MKRTLIAIAALSMLAGCAALNNAGHTAYSVKPVTGSNGKHAGFELDARDGKEYEGGRAIMFNAVTGELAVQEGPSKAFKGQGIAAKAATVLPVDLGNVIAGEK